MKSVKLLLLKVSYSALLIFLIYCYFYEFGSNMDAPIGIMSISSFISAFFILQKVVEKGEKVVSRNNLLKSIFYDSSYIALVLSPVCVLVNGFNPHNIFFAILNVGQILFTTAFITTLYSYLPIKSKITVLSSLPAILLGWMILSDKIFVDLLIFNPIGSFFYGFLGPAFYSKITTILYSIAFFVLIFILFHPIKKHRV